MNWYVFMKEISKVAPQEWTVFFRPKYNILHFYRNHEPALLIDNEDVRIQGLNDLTKAESRLITEFASVNNNRVIFTVDPEWFEDIPKFNPNISIL